MQSQNPALSHLHFTEGFQGGSLLPCSQFSISKVPPALQQPEQSQPLPPHPHGWWSQEASSPPKAEHQLSRLTSSQATWREPAPSLLRLEG